MGFEVTHKATFAGLAGRFAYAVPVGNLFFDGPGVSTLKIGGVRKTFLVDYTHLFRSSSPGAGTPFTVSDIAIGFRLLTPAVAGVPLEFSWKERWMLEKPNSIAKVRVPADYNASWQANGATAPNGVEIAPYPDACVEFWRYTAGNGGSRGGSLRREGQRYFPYFRGDPGKFRFSVSEFSPVRGEHRNKFRVCYYLPSTGTRSHLSSDKIIVCSQITPDGVHGRNVRREGSVWIE